MEVLGKPTWYSRQILIEVGLLRTSISNNNLVLLKITRMFTKGKKDNTQS